MIELANRVLLKGGDNMATTRIDVKPAVLHWVQEASKDFYHRDK